MKYVFNYYFLSYLKKRNAHLWSAWVLVVTQKYKLRVSFKQWSMNVNIHNVVRSYENEYCLEVYVGIFYVGFLQ